MLAVLGDKDDLDRDGYSFEPKLDGTRALCYVDDDVRLLNRRGRDITERYPELSLRDHLKAASCVLDGEVVVYDAKGNPSFPLLQKREHSRTGMVHVLSARHPATYVVFDVLELEGKAVTSSPLEERRELLRTVVRDEPRMQRIVSTREGHRLWSIIESRRLEGVMAKRDGSAYEPGRRSAAWIKVKTVKTIDCVIVGFTSEKRAISALVLGLYFGDELRYMGRVGTGFTDRFMEQMRPVLDGLVVRDPPVQGFPDHPIIWTRPELVAEIEYLQVTKGGHLRAPSFRRIRYDKDPRECTSGSAGIVSLEE